MRKNLHTLIVFVFILLNGFTQEFTRYTTKDGLPSDHIYDILQDKNGFIWFSTNRGIVKFDGLVFKTFTIKDGLPNNDIWMIETNDLGQIWFNSKSKYLGYIKNDSVYTFITEDSTVLSSSIFHVSNEKVWYGDYTLIGDKICDNLKDYLNDLKENLKQKGENQDSMRLAKIPETNQTILIKDSIVSVYNEDLSLAYVFEEKLPYKNYNSNLLMYGVLPNSIYYFAFDDGILFLNYGTQMLRFYNYAHLSSNFNRSLFHLHIFENEIQVSIPHHILKFKYDFTLKEIIKIPKSIKCYLSYQDKEGNIWALNFKNGVTYISSAEVESKYYLLNEKTQKVSAFGDSIIAGVEAKGPYLLNREVNQFRRLDFGDTDKGIIYEIKKNKDNDLCIISSIESYVYFSDSLKRISFKAKLANGNIGTHQSFKNVVYFKDKIYGTTPGLFFEYDLIEKISDNIVFKNGLHVIAGFNNQVFVGGSEGLMLLQDRDLIELGRDQKLLSTPVVFLGIVNNCLAIGTDGRGLFLYRNDEVIPILSTDGLMVQKVIEKDGFVWMATQSGIKKIKLNPDDLMQSKIVDEFYTTDGLLQNNTNDFCLKDSFLYAASDIGITKLNINSPIYKRQPKLYFKTNSDTLVYTYQNNSHISINFQALNYSNQSHLRFKYKLEPFHTDWVETTSRTLNFDGLPPDLYTLELAVIDQHNNRNQISLFIHINPVWWQTAIAKITFILLGLIILFILLKWFRFWIKRKEQNKVIHEKRMAGLELQALRSQMNPHFVFNSLNAIQYYFQRNEVELSENYLVKFSKLVRLFFEYSRKKHISIKSEIELLKNYLLIEQLRFEEKLDFKILIDQEINEEEQMIPSMILQPIVENAVNHGLFHKKTNGEVTIQFKYFSPLSYEVIIKDNGIGVDKAKLIKAKSAQNYQSNSSTVLKERIELLNQSKDWIIDFKIQDLSANESEVGTNVSLKFTQNESIIN